MRLAAAVLSLAVAACGGKVEPTDALPPSTEPSGLEVWPLAKSFSFCRCHHGMGPGVDGDLEVSIRNVSGASHTIEVNQFTLPGEHADYPTTRPQLRMVPEEHRFMNNGSVPSITLPPGASARLMLTVYIDGPSTFSDVAGSRRGRIDLRYGERTMQVGVDVVVIDRGR